jgi:hypothetical protein
MNFQNASPKSGKTQLYVGVHKDREYARAADEQDGGKARKRGHEAPLGAGGWSEKRKRQGHGQLTSSTGRGRWQKHLGRHRG